MRLLLIPTFFLSLLLQFGAVIDTCVDSEHSGGGHFHLSEVAHIVHDDHATCGVHEHSGSHNDCVEFESSIVPASIKRYEATHIYAPTISFLDVINFNHAPPIASYSEIPSHQLSSSIGLVLTKTSVIRC